jgi:hypothetical protein
MLRKAHRTEEQQRESVKISHDAFTPTHSAILILSPKHLARKMDTQTKIIDSAGKLLLCWFLFESIHFLYSGRFMALARMLPQFFQSRIALGLYGIYHMTISTVGALAVVPLMLKGQNAGLILGIAYCLSGHTVSPFDLILPAGSLLSAVNEPTMLSKAADIIWLIFTLSLTILFFLQRRATRDTQTGNV